MSEKSPIEEHEDSVCLTLRVQPRASRNQVTRRNGKLYVALTAPPVDGKANKALCEFVAKWLKVPRRTVQLASGEKSRDKIIRVENMTADTIHKYFEQQEEGAAGV